MRLIDLERATVEIGSVQRLHRTRRIGIRHLDEAEAACAAGIAIGDEGDFLDSSMRGKQSPHAVFGCSKGEISDVELGHFWVLTEIDEIDEKRQQVLPRGHGDFWGGG